MKPLSFVQSLLLTTTIIVGLLATTSCSPQASDQVISPELGPQMQTAEAEAVVITLPTPVPPKFSDLSQEEIFAGVDEDFAALVIASDPTHGEEVATATGCLACHSFDPEAKLIGPTWQYASDHAMNRTDESPALYLYHSIIDPNAFVVDSYPVGRMPQNYSDMLSDEDLASVLAYLLEQHE